ncbi:MAG TPA: hypothetical protein VFB24_13335 [Candidatus Binatia bacterium]|nr:hypothetical protein [Candidatus Binatia bacterium]
MPIPAVEHCNQGLACRCRLNCVIDHDLARANGFVVKALVRARVGLKMASTTCIFGSGMRFTNNSNILGAGTIGDSNPMPITNNVVIKANNTTSTLFIHPDASGFTWRVSSR